MLRLVLTWVTPAAAAIDAAGQSASSAGQGGGEERLLAACRCLLAAARVHRAAGFEAASSALGLAAANGSNGSNGSTAAGGGGAGGVLGLLSELTTTLLAASTAGPELGLEWDGEAAELLLEAWVELVAEPGLGPLGISQDAAAAAAAVFSAVMEQGLMQAAAEALEDEGAPAWRGWAG